MPEHLLDYDAGRGIIRVKFRGLFSAADMTACEDDLITLAARVRRERPHLRVLFDSSESVVQTPEIVERMKRLGGTIRRPGDKQAVLVSSNLMKMQASRCFTTDQEKAFLSPLAADTWLIT